MPDVNARGTVDVYINRMFIGAANRDVLPPWAKFLQGVVECNELTPNAARDNVVRNAALDAVQRALGDLIVNELTELSRLSHRRFVEIMRWHAYHVLAMSVQDEHEGFFRAVADLVPLDSDRGPITVAEYLEAVPPRTDGARPVHYITERGSANQYFLLAGARSIRVFNCAEAFAEAFLERYARTWPQKVHLNRLDVAGSDTIFEPLADDEIERFADLQARYDAIFPGHRYVARVSRFRPPELPAVLTETHGGKGRREMRQVAAGRVGAGDLQAAQPGDRAHALARRGEGDAGGHAQRAGDGIRGAARLAAGGRRPGPVRLVFRRDAVPRPACA
jgi:HSP90 family molecular chaperone